MGTNYYLRKPIDEKQISSIFDEAKKQFLSNRDVDLIDLKIALQSFEQIHLGKASYGPNGPRFTIQAYRTRNYTDLKTFKKFLDTGIISDENGNEISKKEFLKKLKSRDNIPTDSRRDYPSVYFFREGYWWCNARFS